MADDPFFARTGMDRNRIDALVREALHSAEDGELFLEYCQSESLLFDDGRLKAANVDTTQGFGLRAVCGEATGYAHATELSEEAIRRAGQTVQAVARGYAGTAALPPANQATRLYPAIDPLADAGFAAKVKQLADMDAYARAKDARVRQVSCSLRGERQTVEILRLDGAHFFDERPLVRLYVSVVMEAGGRQQTGSYGGGGRTGYETLLSEAYWKHAVDEALREAEVNLSSIPAPAGEMTVVLGPGWPGILLHEAIGHGLEGDFNRKKTSAFSGLIGEQVAAAGVTVIDDGSIAGRRGSLAFDDEGTPTSPTVLIENGVLKGYMQDRQNARLMGTRSTGNGRRESFASLVMPRMTNTFMLGGDTPPGDILAGVKKGIYAVNFGGGQVDITSGKFVFSCTEAYLLEDGKIGPAIKGATLIGSGPDVLKRITRIGNDMHLDNGIGTCGKSGQSVPVGVGLPTLRLDGLTVGGTAAG